MIAINKAIIIKNSKELNGSIIKIVDRQIEQPNLFYFSGGYLRESTKNIMKIKLLNIK